jgi:hypothetical protein
MTGPTFADGIKLRADDADDLKIIAACLQDAIVPIGEVAYLPEHQSFVMMVNRFRWELSGREPAEPQRVNCAVTVLGITGVRRRNIDLRDRALLLNLLTIQPGTDGLDLVFADDRAIHLASARWRCLIEDVGAPWPAGAVPRHRLGDA